MIYIQSDEFGFPHHFDAACAFYGAMDSCRKFKLITFEEISSGKFDFLLSKNLAVGSVEFMNEVFKRLNIKTPTVPYNSNRAGRIITLGMAKKHVEKGNKIFIKPTQIKLFTGFVLDNSSYSCLNGLPDDLEIISYEPFSKKIISEFRLYIHKHEIVDSRHYSGNVFKTPDYNYAKEIVELNKKTFPCAYNMDIGILEDNENVVIEFNDMWAAGNYGIPNDLYVKLLWDRYFEIIENNIK